MRGVRPSCSSCGVQHSRDRCPNSSQAPFPEGMNRRYSRPGSLPQLQPWLAVPPLALPLPSGVCHLPQRQSPSHPLWHITRCSEAPQRSCLHSHSQVAPRRARSIPRQPPSSATVWAALLRTHPANCLLTMLSPASVDHGFGIGFSPSVHQPGLSCARNLSSSLRYRDFVVTHT